ncbi:aspartate--tRNA ligase, partial [Francisella tularensis subsp. holarctica]|nr:aspartate--tRNA ligase [Francisella tularensis subsp. holarctica]
ICVEFATPFQVMTFADAIDNYGSDKPDLRIPIEFVNIKEDMQNEEFNVFSGPANDPQSRVIALIISCGNDKLTRKMIDEYKKFVGI